MHCAAGSGGPSRPPGHVLQVKVPWPRPPPGTVGTSGLALAWIGVQSPHCPRDSSFTPRFAGEEEEQDSAPDMRRFKKPRSRAKKARATVPVVVGAWVAVASGRNEMGTRSSVRTGHQGCGGQQEAPQGPRLPWTGLWPTAHLEEASGRLGPQPLSGPLCCCPVTPRRCHRSAWTATPCCRRARLTRTERRRWMTRRPPWARTWTLT